MVLLKHKEKEKNNMTQSDFEDFEDLDTYLNSEEFSKAYDEAVYKPTGKSWAGNNPDWSGMTIEDISGFPTPERDM